jgi:hypothetical protein
MPKDLNGNPHATFNIGLHDKQIKVDFQTLDSYPLGKLLPQMRLLSLQNRTIQSDQIRIHLLSRRTHMGNGLVPLSRFQSRQYVTLCFAESS